MRTTFSLRRPSRRAARRILAGVFALGPGLLLAAAAAGPVAAAGPITSSACTAAGTIVTCNLWAKTGTLGLPTGGTVPVWGFATSAGGAAEVPGPVLVVTEGDSVTVNLTNSLGVSTALDLGGTTLVPGSRGDRPGRIHGLHVHRRNARDLHVRRGPHARDRVPGGARDDRCARRPPCRRPRPGIRGRLHGVHRRGPRRLRRDRSGAQQRRLAGRLRPPHLRADLVRPQRRGVPQRDRHHDDPRADRSSSGM